MTIMRLFNCLGGKVLTAVMLLLCGLIYAQDNNLYNNDASGIFNTGTILSIHGSYIQSDSGFLYFTHDVSVPNGSLYITNNLTNSSSTNVYGNNLFKPYNEGAVYLVGDTNSIISTESGNIVFDKLFVQKDVFAVQMLSNFTVLDSMVFVSGNVHLNDDTIILDQYDSIPLVPRSSTDGSLYNEGDNQRTIGGGEVRKTRYINTGDFENIKDFGGMGDEIRSGGISDIFTVRRGNTALVTPQGPSINRYFDFNTSSAPDAELKFHYFQSDLGGSAENAWVFYRSDDQGSTWTSKLADSSDAGLNFAVMDSAADLGLISIRNCDVTPSVPTGQGGIYCSATNITLDGGPGKTNYGWSTGGTTQTINLALSGSVSLYDTIFVRVDSAGCYTLDTIYVQYHPAIVLNLPQTLSVCVGGSLELDATQADASAAYQWSITDTANNYSNSAKIFVDSAHTYIIEVSYTGCNALDTVVVTGSSGSTTAITVNADTQNLSCFNDTTGHIELTVQGGAGGFKYNWNNGDTTQNLTRIRGGAYIVTITDQNLCAQVDSFNILEPNPLYAVFQKSDEGCPLDNNGTIGITLHGGTSPYTALWSTGDTSTSGIINLDHGQYNFTVTDAHGCQISDTAVVDSVPPIQAAFLAATPVRALDTIYFVDVSYPAPVSYLWSFGDSLLSTSTDTNPTFAYPLKEGVDTSYYTVKLIVWEAGGCVDSVSEIIKVWDHVGKNDPAIPVPSADIPLAFVKLNAYPNPTSGYLTVNIELSKEGVVGMKLFDLSGQSILTTAFSGKNQYSQQVNLNNLTAGIYLIQLQTGDELSYMKIVLTQ